MERKFKYPNLFLGSVKLPETMQDSKETADLCVCCGKPSYIHKQTISLGLGLMSSCFSPRPSSNDENESPVVCSECINKLAFANTLRDTVVDIGKKGDRKHQDGLVYYNGDILNTRDEGVIKKAMGIDVKMIRPRDVSIRGKPGYIPEPENPNPTTRKTRTVMFVVDQFQIKTTRCNHLEIVKATAGFVKEAHRETPLNGFKCPLCPKRFSTVDKLKKHEEKRGPKRINCNLCPLAFHNKRLLQDHSVKHAYRNMYSCVMCRKTFKEFDQFIEHTALHGAIKSHGCPHCKKTFVSKKVLDNHKLRHKETENTALIAER